MKRRAPHIQRIKEGYGDKFDGERRPMIKNYWREVYGPRSEEFIEGVIAGVTAFAVWEDGREVVGIMKRSLREEIVEIREGLGG
jgi:hypothetical protein